MTVARPNGELYGDIKSVASGRYIGKATFVSELGKIVGPQAAWALITYAVGQHYERQTHEIDSARVKVNHELVRQQARLRNLEE